MTVATIVYYMHNVRFFLLRHAIPASIPRRQEIQGGIAMPEGPVPRRRHDLRRLHSQKIGRNVVPFSFEKLRDAETPLPGNAAHRPVPDRRGSATVHAKLARHLRWSAKLGDESGMRVFFPIHAGISQHFVERVNTAMLNARKKQTGDDRAMSNSKPPNRAKLQFGRRLTAVREAAGYDTQTDFAVALGMSVQRYSRYERGETEPSILTLQQIQKLTGVSLDFLVSGEMRPMPMEAANEPQLPAPRALITKE